MLMLLNTDQSLHQRSEHALQDTFLQKAVAFTTERLREKKQKSTDALGYWEEWRLRGQQIRAHTIEYLDYYLEQFATNVEKAGGQVYFAEDGAKAAQIALTIAKQNKAKQVVKSKSMVTEEVEINAVFEKEGITCIETDLGEYIVQLAKQTPSHIIIPAIHQTREQIAQLFSAQKGEQVSTETKALTAFARRKLREVFAQAEIGMTGCNFAIAESGSIVLFSNEGNARMVTTLPKTHIVLMGMERIIPTWEDLEVMANLLPRSATGQKLTSYMSILTGPKRKNEQDGPEELHVIIVDNGRSNQLGDPKFQAILHCIRCGACLNVCPVYRQIGGHAYGSVYPGPIGAVLSPLLKPDEEQVQELPYASSLCGACYEACPVKIPLHDMLVYLRERRVKEQKGWTAEKIAFRGYSTLFKQQAYYRWMMKTIRHVQKWSVKDGSRWSGILSRFPMIQGWVRSRHLPFSSQKSFREQWDTLKKELEAGADQDG